MITACACRGWVREACARSALRFYSRHGIRSRTPGPARSPWHGEPGSDRVQSHLGTLRTSWWTGRAGKVAILTRSTPRQTRWSPHWYWPVLQLLLLFPSQEGFSGFRLRLRLELQSNWTVSTGFAASEPVVTPVSLAAFAGARRPHSSGGRTPIPAAFR